MNQGQGPDEAEEKKEKRKDRRDKPDGSKRRKTTPTPNE